VAAAARACRYRPRAQEEESRVKGKERKSRETKDGKEEEWEGESPVAASRMLPGACSRARGGSVRLQHGGCLRKWP